MKLPLRSAGLLAAATLAVGAAWPQASRADRVRFDREGVLGTSSSIVLDVPGPLAAGVEASTYAEVERLRKQKMILTMFVAIGTSLNGRTGIVHQYLS